jgi:Cu/Zn superoxide dismutase
MKRVMGVIVAVLTMIAMSGVPSTRAQIPPQYFTTNLAPGEEVPICAASVTSGATGVAFLKVVNQTAGTVEYTFVVGSLPDAPIAAHIHIAPRGVAGPIVQALTITSGGPTFAYGAGAFTNPTLLAAIQSSPSGYYVNVHTMLCPAGAARGQLG